MRGALRERIASVGQLFKDRVRECIDAGLLQPLDPTAVATTLWAHAHGLISIFLRGWLHMDVDTFRQTYRDSCRRTIAGIATARYGPAMDRAREAIPAVGPAACAGSPAP